MLSVFVMCNNHRFHIIGTCIIVVSHVILLALVVFIPVVLTLLIIKQKLKAIKTDVINTAAIFLFQGNDHKPIFSLHSNLNFKSPETINKTRLMELFLILNLLFCFKYN